VHLVIHNTKQVDTHDHFSQTRCKVPAESPENTMLVAMLNEKYSNKSVTRARTYSEEQTIVYIFISTKLYPRMTSNKPDESHESPIPKLRLKLEHHYMVRVNKTCQYMFGVKSLLAELPHVAV
jgi:hypothetical protein